MKTRIAIVDDDDALRDSLGVLLKLRDYDVLEFGDGDSFLSSGSMGKLDCLILDLKMPGSNGLEVLRACRGYGHSTPIIVVTAFGDVASAKTALKGGAFDFVEKPVDWDEMLHLVETSVTQHRRSHAEDPERASVEGCMARLSGREREILDAVLAGKHNREIAAALGLSVRTVEVYKARMMEKMRVSRLAELIRMFARLEAKSSVTTSSMEVS